MNCPNDSTDAGDDDIFMKKFKQYKRRNPPPDFSDVIDFSALTPDVNHFAGEEITRVKLDDTCLGNIEGMINLRDWKVYTLKRLPGVAFIQNPFLPVYQRYWAWRSLAAYPLRPNVCNLDKDPQTDRGTVGDVWQQAHANGHNGTSSQSKPHLLQKLRWVTLGYHYDWTNKVYESSHVSPFPADLSDLSHCLATVLGYPNYTAEAAIVNYYHADSTLSGHTDHSEFDKRAPLMSISFGQSAIFMVGGQSRRTPPAAMLLRSGDIVVLADESRLAYHAVPRVLITDKHLNCNNPLQTAIAAALPGGHNSMESGCSKLEAKRARRDDTSLAEQQPVTDAATQNSTQEHLALAQDTDVDTVESVPVAVLPPGEVSHSHIEREAARTNTLASTDGSTAAVIKWEDPLLVHYCADTLSYVTSEKLWRPFHAFLLKARINLNVRQVVESGKKVEDYC